MKFNHILILFGVCIYINASAQISGNILEGTNGIITDQSGNKTITCGFSYIYFTALERISSSQNDMVGFLNFLESKGKEKLESAGFTCGKCDDPAAGGCELMVKLMYDNDLIIAEERVDGKQIFTLVPQDVVLRVECSLCHPDPNLTPSGTQVISSSDLRIRNIKLEPILYEVGPDIGPNVHAYFTFEMKQGDQLEYLNARLSDPSTGTSLWLVENIPLPAHHQSEIISYTINVEAFGSAYSFLYCEYNVSSIGQSDPQFPALGSMDLIPEPAVYHVPSGSSDPALPIGDVPAGPGLIGSLPGFGGTAVLSRLLMPNIDLDYSKDPTDSMACGPAAAGNSLHWLVRQHKELAHEKSSLRAKVDSLKRYMNRSNKIGVRFDSMVVGKLTLIDKLKLPIRVKYKTKHESGNTDDPLASTEPPAHTADNKGKLGEHPDFDWLKKEIDDGEDVEVHVGWYGPPDKDGKRVRHGGHWLVASGYSSAKDKKGVYLKDDDVQSKAGGTRSKYYKWAKLLDETPYLEDLKDRKGNIAVVESVVSESYDPTVTFDEEVAAPITEPWSDIALTGERMKPGYPFLIPEDSNKFPWIPVFAGVTGVGVVTYLVTQNDDKPEDCAFTALPQISPATCELSNGDISINVFPADQYQYQWSNGSINSGLQNISAGNYVVTITRTGTDCSTILPLTVSNSNPSFDATITTQGADCGMQNGSAIINVSPAAFYTITWSTGGTQAVHNNLAPGNYSVTVSLGGVCTKEYSLSIEELSPSFEVSVNTTPSSCGQADGSGEVNVIPAGFYDIEWSNGISGSQTTGLSAGEYKITVTIPGTTCSKTITTNVGELPPDFEITVTTTPAICGQSNGTGNISVNPPGNYQYEWPGGITGSQVIDLAAGDYNITVSISGTKCSKTILANVDELPPDFEITFNTTSSDCGGANGSGTINVNPPDSYMITWSNGTMGAQASGLAPGNYQVTVTEEGTTCSKDTSVTITELSPTFMITSSTTPSGCTDSTGTATISVNPPGTYDITWSTGYVGPQITGLPTGTYSVTITITGTTCSNTASITIDQTGAEFTATISTDAAGCGVSDGSATITVNPAADYTYQWPDQQSGPVAQQLLAGEYSVVVTDINGCSASFTATVGEDPAEYITTTGTTPGACIGGGDIAFTLSQPVPLGSGPLHLNLITPGGPIAFTLTPGGYLLSSFIAVLSGEYMISVYNDSIGQNCTEIVNITVVDNTPVLNVMDDLYTTTGGEPLIENALDNDGGLNIEMTSVLDIIGGTVVFNSDGNFTFFPDQGFSGDASFNYVVTDACGTTATGVVAIFVEEAICEFTISDTPTPASCGLDDGSILVEVDQGGTYAFTWNTGDTGPLLDNVPAGIYTVTIEDVDLGCSLEFLFQLTEYPADYIDDIIVTQPSCNSDGEIQFTAFTSSQNPLIMSVDHPGGGNLFFIEPGIIRLSDFVPIVPGGYTVEVTDAGAGSDCFESFFVNIIAPPPAVEIHTEFVMPPSTPSGMDGSIFIVSVIPGVLPYMVFLNSLPFSVINEVNFTIEGLGVGTYDIQVLDANGCISNVLVVNMPLPDIIVSIGTGLIYAGSPVYVPEQSTANSAHGMQSGFISSLQYFQGKLSPELRIMYVPPGMSTSHEGSSDFLSVDLLSELTSIQWKKNELKLQGGVGLRTFFNESRIATIIIREPQYWILRGNAHHNLFKTMDVQYSISLQGWSSIEQPVMDISVSMLLHRPLHRMLK